MKNSLQIAPGRPDAGRAKASFGETWRCRAPGAESATLRLVQITKDSGVSAARAVSLGGPSFHEGGATPGVLDLQGLAGLKGCDERPK